MNGYTAMTGAVFLIAGVAFWCYEKLPRGVTWLLAVAAACGVATITAWRDDLMRITGQGGGLGVLAALSVLAVLGFLFEGILRHRYHPLRSPGFGIAFGVALVLVLGHLSKLVKGSGTAVRAAAMNVAGQSAQAGAQTHISNTAALIGAGAVAGLLLFLAINVKGGGGGGRKRRRPAAGAGGLSPAGRRTSSLPPSSRTTARPRTAAPGSSSSRTFPPRPGSSGRTP